MKNLRKISLALLLMGVVQSSYGVNICLNLNSASTCSADRSRGAADWSATCGNNLAVKGVAMCSPTSASKIGDKTNVLESYYEKSLFCWCRMIIPTASYWGFVKKYIDPYQCAINCSDECGYVLTQNAALRAALFTL